VCVRGVPHGAYCHRRGRGCWGELLSAHCNVLYYTQAKLNHVQGVSFHSNPNNLLGVSVQRNTLYILPQNSTV
jgi:hypothetical protein